MSKKTGAFRPLVGVKLPIGGFDEDGVDLHITDNKINAAKERAKTEMRVQARRLYDFRNTPGAHPLGVSKIWVNVSFCAKTPAGL